MLSLGIKSSCQLRIIVTCAKTAEAKTDWRTAFWGCKVPCPQSIDCGLQGGVVDARNVDVARADRTRPMDCRPRSLKFQAASHAPRPDPMAANPRRARPRSGNVARLASKARVVDLDCWSRAAARARSLGSWNHGETSSRARWKTRNAIGQCRRNSSKRRAKRRARPIASRPLASSQRQTGLGAGSTASSRSRRNGRTAGGSHKSTSTA